MTFYTIRTIASAMLILAPLPLPGAYYTMLRWTISLVCIYGVGVSSSRRRYAWALTFLLLLGVFNPLDPVQLEPMAWLLIDVCAAGVLLISMPRLRNNQSWVIGQPPEPNEKADSFDLFTYRLKRAILDQYVGLRAGGCSRTGTIARMAMMYVGLGWVLCLVFGLQVLELAGLEGREHAIIGVAYLFLVTVAIVVGLSLWLRRHFF